MKKIVLLGIATIIVIGGIIIALQIRIIKKQTLVDNFPHVPVYPAAVLQNSSCNDVQSMLFRARWTSQGNVPQLMKWYSDRLQKEGWKLDVPPGDIHSESIQYAEFTQGLFNSWLSKLQLSIQANKNAPGSSIELSFPAPDSEREEKN